MNRHLRTALISLLAIVSIVWLASNTLISKPNHASQTITTYSDLQNAITSGQPKFKLVVFDPSKRSLTATEADGKTTARAGSGARASTARRPRPGRQRRESGSGRAGSTGPPTARLPSNSACERPAARRPSGVATMMSPLAG